MHLRQLVPARHGARKGACEGPEETEHDLYTDVGKQPKGAKLKAVRVNPGTVLVQAHPVESASGKVSNPSPNSWYVLKDDPVLEGDNVTNPTQSNDESTGQPDVTFGFTSHGKKVFEQVTKEIAHRGQEAQLPGVSKEAGAAALRGRARRPADHGAVDRLHQVPGRDRRLHRLGDLRRLHDHHRSGPRQRAAVRARCRSSSC